MKVLNIHEVGDVRLDEYVRPEHGPNDVVVKMKAVGICGSDLSYIKMGGIMRQPGGVTPIGHEGAGEVLHVGSAVEGIRPGDPVIINPMNTPSSVGSGGPEGAFVDELLVREARLNDSILPIPEGIPYEIAAMCEPLAVAMHGVNRMEVKPGDKVVVFGCGPIGLGMILWLIDRGVTDLIALDLAQERLDRAMALGARAAFSPLKCDIKEEIGKQEIVRKIPGRLKWEDITLKRGLTSNMDIWSWRQMVEGGDIQGARKNGSVTMLNQNLQPVAEWQFFNAWPSKVTGPQPKSDSNEIGVEELTIVHEFIERTR